MTRIVFYFLIAVLKRMNFCRRSRANKNSPRKQNHLREKIAWENPPTRGKLREKIKEKGQQKKKATKKPRRKINSIFHFTSHFQDFVPLNMDSQKYLCTAYPGGGGKSGVELVCTALSDQQSTGRSTVVQSAKQQKVQSGKQQSYVADGRYSTAIVNASHYSVNNTRVVARPAVPVVNCKNDKKHHSSSSSSAHHRPHRSHSSSSSSSSTQHCPNFSHSSSSSSDCPPQQPVRGGLGDVCQINQQCATGLACQNGVCVCPKPEPPQVRVTVNQETREVTLQLSRVFGADFSNIILTDFQDNVVVSRDFFVGNRITFGPLAPGEFTATVFSGSNACGVDPDRFSEVMGIVIEGNGGGDGNGGLGDVCQVDQDCATGLACQGEVCVCPKPGATAITGSVGADRRVVVDWTEVQGADYYIISVTRLNGEIILGIPFITDNQITFGPVTPGQYVVVIYSASDACGVNRDSFAQAGITVNEDGTGGVFPIPLRR